MSRARLQLTPDVSIWASDYDKEKHGEVVCFFCRCRVRGVRAYSRNVGDKQITVAAYFSLWKHVDHANLCRYNVDKTIRRFVAYSKAIRKIVPDAVPILDKVGQRQAAEFRLHILMEALQKQTSGFRPSRHHIKWVPLVDGEESTGTEYVRTDKVLKPYFRTAKGILSLAARLQSNPDLEAWISLKFGDQRISWDEFLFDYSLERYRVLYHYLQRQNQTHITRPIAIVAKVSKKTGLYESNKEYRLNGSACVVRIPEGKLAVRPVFYFRDKHLAERSLQEDLILVCGLPRLGNQKAPLSESSWLSPRIEVSIKVVDGRQMCRYNPK